MKDGEGNVVDEVSHSSGSTRCFRRKDVLASSSSPKRWTSLLAPTPSKELIVSKRDGTVLDAEEVTVEV